MMAKTLVFHFEKLSVQRSISGHKVFLSRQFSQNVVDSKIILRRALENYKDLDFRFIRITGHGFGTSFSNTPLRYRRLKVPDDANVILETKFSTVFSTGFQGLKNYVYNNVLETSESQLPLCPLAALSVFLTEVRKEEKTLKDGFNKYGKDISEIWVAALLTNHLLSCLVYGNQYMICNDYRPKPKVCPCTNANCRMDIKYGQTGLGHADIWYSRPDVVLIPKQAADYMVPLWYINELEEEENEDYDDDIHPLEIKDQSKFKTLASQVLSQAITFAFYQSNIMKKRGIVPLTTLVPSLILTPNHYYVIMYDYKNDILLSSGHSDSSLWYDSNDYRLNLSAILHIWMVLNYKDFIPKLDPEVSRHFVKSSNVHNILESLNLFEETKKIERKNSFSFDANDDEVNGNVRDVQDYLKDSHDNGKLWY
uniref:Uncharacterized protein LOC111107225 n=1 Tax=Crassostrea virginica TaxID=6565 RepID=A0A8B8B4L0_CRAVI|nr:uncharacterized protein LOC111107225 [Crassostrea virginica]